MLFKKPPEKYSSSEKKDVHKKEFKKSFLSLLISFEGNRKQNKNYE